MPPPRPNPTAAWTNTRALAALLASVLLVAAWPRTAGAQVHRCNAPDGTSIFTDRACASLGATASLPDAGTHGARHASRMRCMGSVQDLMFEMSMAFDAGDPNRLASVYHWAGMSSGSAYATIERLDRMVSRPLVDIVAMMPTPPEPPPTQQPMPRRPAADAASTGRSPEPAEEDQSYVETLARRYADSPEPEPAVHHAAAVAAPGRPTPPPTTLPPAPVVPVTAARPVGIKVVQTLTDGVTPTSTVFGLTRHFGCWWIRN
ncbi:hypothetical protein [Marilutibacter aestuarii]|uniref:DUF4124 domain-containing protein n=1 Tax=Marilutibacter aestuarii TaxID=1706195 RepID=A0A508ACM4_9GAMM|nr:hypothetical protein [Lysobacter aestuarii]TQD45578.1 hypothetical protein FKV25_07855 [Lysobacter aestuarii]